MSEKRSIKFWIGVGILILLMILSISGGVYLSIRFNKEMLKTTGLFTSIILLFILMILIGYSNNYNLDKGEIRRAITVTFALTFLMIIFFKIETDSKFMDFFLGVLATIIGFYFGYRK